MAYSGFCVGGIDWPRPELAHVDDPALRHEILRGIGKQEAALVHGLGGNLLRIFYSVAALINDPNDDTPVVFPGTLDLRPQAVVTSSLGERLKRLDSADATLDDLLAEVGGRLHNNDRFNFQSLDAYVAGVGDFNREAAMPQGVRALLTLVSIPPRWIIEAPSSTTLAANGRGYTHSSLWRRYLMVHELLHGALIDRYIGEPEANGEPPIVCAFEVCNEPDYCWIPAEMKIEWGSTDTESPLWKYVTELHLAQVPEYATLPPPSEATDVGYQAQDFEWVTSERRPTPIVDFDWGPKFDWYIKCFAELHQCIAEAIADSASHYTSKVEIVSGSVTHNNIDYLLRMARTNPAAFAAVTKIGIHPYHWVNNDVWDDDFVSGVSMASWQDASPREFARSYLKRFDFLEELASLIQRRSGPEDPADSVAFELSRALAGKELWITEFGIGTKALGTFNSPVAKHTRFIRPRENVGIAGGYAARIWEDLWESFLDQVDAGYLRNNQVDCLLIYALREAGSIGLDMNDDDRSNFAVLRRDGTNRMDASTLVRLSHVLTDLSGQSRKLGGATRPGLELHRRPWRKAATPNGVFETLTMLSREERSLLHWLAADYFDGAGAIVDAGCFLGGSTVALALGLEKNAAGRGTKIDVFDRFEVEPYMVDFYFGPDELAPGDSFRAMFDRNTKSVKARLNVHDGDFLSAHWPAKPIEILFVDIAKSWALNDTVINQFLPYLIPDRSVLIQQDLVFSSCHWIPITMELLADYFEPVSFVEHNSVVYICRKQIPQDVAAPSVESLPSKQKVEFLDRAIERFRGYPRGLLELAKGSLLLELGQAEAAKRQISRTSDSYNSEPLVAQSLEMMPANVRAEIDASAVSSAESAQAAENESRPRPSATRTPAAQPPLGTRTSKATDERDRYSASRATSALTPGRAGVSERLRIFVNEFRYERGPIFEFLKESADRLPTGSDVADVGAGEAPYRELFEHTNYVTIDWQYSVHEGAAQSDIIASADSLPIDDESFDAIILTQVLEHVPEPTRVLRELRRVTRPGGRLFLTAPLVWELHEAPFDFYRYTEHGLRHLLQKAGYERVEVSARNDCFTTLAQLMQNVSWMIDENAPDRDLRVEAAGMLRRFAAELATLAPLDNRRIFPLGYAVVAHRL